MQRTTRPPSKGYTGSRLNRPCTIPQIESFGKTEDKRCKERLPAGPAIMLNNSPHGDKKDALITAPDRPTLIPSIFPPARSTAKIWHNSWKSAAVNDAMSQSSGNTRHSNAIKKQEKPLSSARIPMLHHRNPEVSCCI